MPTEFDNPIIENLSKTHRKIESFSVDVIKKELYISYYDGNDDGQGGINKVTRASQATVIGTDFNAIVSRANAILNGQETANVYAALKQAFYEHLINVTGDNGSITP
jgi:hypothetical protein